jgi:thiol:disulfide interchange protein
MNQPAAYRSAPATSALAVVSLVFGIATWLLLPLLGAIVAIVCGHLARSEIRRAPLGSIDGDGMALAGLILGYLHLLIGVLAVMLVAGVFFGALAMHWH